MELLLSPLSLLMLLSLLLLLVVVAFRPFEVSRVMAVQNYCYIVYDWQRTTKVKRMF